MSICPQQGPRPLRGVSLWEGRRDPLITCANKRNSSSHLRTPQTPGGPAGGAPAPAQRRPRRDRGSPGAPAPGRPAGSSRGRSPRGAHRRRPPGNAGLLTPRSLGLGRLPRKPECPPELKAVPAGRSLRNARCDGCLALCEPRNAPFFPAACPPRFSSFPERDPALGGVCTSPAHPWEQRPRPCTCFCYRSS